MLNNLTNYLNLISERKYRTASTVDGTDLITLGVKDPNFGGVELWLAGGGNTTILVSSTPYGPGAGSLTINGTINGYTWENVNNQAGPFTFTVIKTRNGA